MNNAQAAGYYVEQDGYYYEQQPRYTRQVNYQQPRHETVRYVQENSPRYRRVTSADAARYREPTYRQTTYYNEPKVNTVRPYIGLDFATQKLKFSNDQIAGKNFKDKTTSFDGVAGLKINRNFSIEAYYQQSSKANKDITYTLEVESVRKTQSGETSISYKSYGADAIGHLPINQEFELLAALGLGQYDFKSKGPSIDIDVTDNGDGTYNMTVKEITKKKDFDSLGIRIGFGAQYNVTDHIALRAMARYVKMTKDDYIKNLTELSLGIRYLF